jgi:FeS assembly protein SufD
MNVETLAQLAEANLANAGSLQGFRKTHLEQFKAQGLKRDPEAYKFTNVTSFFEKLNDTTDGGIAPTLKAEDFHHVILKDGKELQFPEIDGVTFKWIEDASIFETFKSNNPLTHLHHGMSDILEIEVKKKTKLTKPLKFTYFESSGAVKALTLHFKIRSQAEVSILENYSGSASTHVLATETYFTLESASQVEHVQFDHSGAEGLHHQVTIAKAARDAQYRNVAFHLGGKLIRRNLALELTEAGAHGESYALYLTQGEEHSDLSTVIHHLAPDTTSDQVAKGILDGNSKGIFTGRIHIHPKAQRVASGQLNKNLLLSKKAQAHSQPQLEIFADDVKCSHGSTTGQLSPEEIFYFKARGIPEERARTLLAHAFGMEVVIKIADRTIRNLIEGQILTAMREKFHIGGQL